MEDTKERSMYTVDWQDLPTTVYPTWQSKQLQPVKTFFDQIFCNENCQNIFPTQINFDDIFDRSFLGWTLVISREI